MKVEANNPKFNFLRFQDDPYRPYYIQQLKQIQVEINGEAADDTNED